MAIEIIQKAKIKKTPPIHIAIYLLLAALSAFIIGYFLLNSYQAGMAKELADMEKALERSPSEKNLEDALLSYQKRIKDMDFLLDRHWHSANFFDYLEKLSHPKVQFLDLKLDVEGKTASLGGVADGFESFGQQVMIFEKEPLIKNIELSDVSISKDGQIRFGLQFSLDPEIFSPVSP